MAEEVERLAERSNRLTRQIATLTHTINTETKEVVASMEDTVHEVVVGSALADKAGQSLFAIEATSNNCPNCFARSLMPRNSRRKARKIFRMRCRASRRSPR